MKLHILVTCHNPELVRASTMVFDTIRVGFPTADIRVTINSGTKADCLEIINYAILKAGLSVHRFTKTIHHEWIGDLLETESEPFYICDTDVVFWKSFEGFKFATPLAGRWTPRFYDKFTKAITDYRFHTSLLYIDPVLVKKKVDEYEACIPQTHFNPDYKPTIDLIRPVIYPTWEGRVFRDTCSILSMVTGGTKFTAEHLDCYDHLNFGTVSDIVAPCYPDQRFRQQHFAIFENPKLAKGMWQEQDNFYKQNAI